MPTHPTMTLATRRVLCTALFLAFAPAAHADDILIDAHKLSITDNSPSGGRDKVLFQSRDKYSGIDKGAPFDPNAISVEFRVSWEGVSGGFSIPTGFRAKGTPTGWIRNDERSARFVNRNAKTGTPTGVSSFAIAPDRSIKLVARTRGDDPIDLATNPPAYGVRVEVIINNDGDVVRHCTAFRPGDIKIRARRDGGRKLSAKNGVREECPREEVPVELAPEPNLPPVPAAPYLWFDGADPNALAAVVARTTHPQTSGLFSSIRSTVNAALSSLGSASEDVLARTAKGAGLLFVVGETPPPGSGYASYADVVVDALSGMGTRNALDDPSEILDPPDDPLNILHDAGRLQSMAEAYDLVRGAGLAAGDDTAMRDRIANWAGQYMTDWNIAGDPFGLFVGHRDNWAIKGASALITAALAMPDHADAASWLAQGTEWINESLAEVVRGPGWYAESAHYLNYTLNNLVSTAWQVRNATGTDWFDDLEPFVDVAFDLRQPDGREPSFEEGHAITFPWDVLIGAYPGRAGTMQWAWDNSPRDVGSFGNQQYHAVTRFFVHELDVAATEPNDPPTRFLEGDVNAIVLRSSHAADALQITTMTAIDTSSSELVSSRHHMENPLDLVLHGAGALLVATASGGPEVTSSANRSYYLQPAAKNIPLVDDNAPYLLASLLVDMTDTLDSRDSEGRTHRFFDAATTTVSPFAPEVDVSRTVAMVGETYAVVVDRFIGEDEHEYEVRWRGRGDANARANTSSHIAADYAWPNASAPSAHLAIDTLSASSLTGGLGSGFYAPTYGSEESLAPLAVSTDGEEATVLSVLRPRTDGSSASTLTELAASAGVAARISNATTEDTIVAGADGDSRAAGGVESDGRLAIVRKEAGTVTAIAAVRAEEVEVDGAKLIDATGPLTFAATIEPGAVVITIAPGIRKPVRLTLTELPGIDPEASHSATFDGAPVDPDDFDDGRRMRFIARRGGVLVITEP